MVQLQVELHCFGRDTNKLVVDGKVVIEKSSMPGILACLAGLSEESSVELITITPPVFVGASPLEGAYLLGRNTSAAGIGNFIPEEIPGLQKTRKRLQDRGWVKTMDEHRNDMSAELIALFDKLLAGHAFAPEEQKQFDTLRNEFWVSSIGSSFVMRGK